MLNDGVFYPCGRDAGRLLRGAVGALCLRTSVEGVFAFGFAQALINRNVGRNMVINMRYWAEPEEEYAVPMKKHSCAAMDRKCCFIRRENVLALGMPTDCAAVILQFVRMA